MGSQHPRAEFHARGFGTVPGEGLTGSPRTRGKLADGPQPTRNSPASWDSLRRLLSMEEIRSCRCKSGELCLLATASRQDIRARLALAAATVNPLRVYDSYRINDSPKNNDRMAADDSFRNALTLAGRSDAAEGDQTKGGRCRLDFLFGLLLSSLRGPCRSLHPSPLLLERLSKVV